MRFFLAIFAALLTVLPHPALLAACSGEAHGCGRAAKASAPVESCCPCCKKQCACDAVPAPAPQHNPGAPVNPHDCHPAPALPPGEAILPQQTAIPVCRSAGMCADATAAGCRPHVPLYVRHRAFLI